MDAGTRRLFVAAIVLIVAVVGGAALFLGDPADTPGSTPTAVAPSATPTATDGGSVTAPPTTAGAIPPSPVSGVIVAVDSRGLDDVRAFTLRTDDGAILVFDLREMQATATFPLGHLAEHQATAEPVLVAFRVEDGVLVATQVDDA